MSTRVTIHMPTYNQGRFIAHALEGALTQTDDDYRVIVSNNHSTDDTDAVLARYAGHPRLTIVKPPTFLDVVAHFKFVVAQSDSEYFSYLCTDDGVFPDFLKEQVALLDKYPAGRLRALGRGDDWQRRRAPLPREVDPPDRRHPRQTSLRELHLQRQVRR